MTIAVIADLHLTTMRSTIQWDCFDWILEELKKNPPDVLVAAGDLSADGDLEVIDTFLKRIQEVPCKKLIIRGNSDLRSHPEEAKRRLSEYEELVLGDYRLIAADKGDGTWLKIDFSKYREKVLFFSHHDFTEKIEDVPNLMLYVFGHVHEDRMEKRGQTMIYATAGCDPDKTIGTAPKIAWFELPEGKAGSREGKIDSREEKIGKAVTNEGGEPSAKIRRDAGKIVRYDRIFTEAGFGEWSREEKEEFRKNLGLSCYQPLTGVPRAAAEGIFCIELRPNALKCPRKEVLKAVKEWREKGGRYLSLHMPDLGIDFFCGSEKISGNEAWQEAIILAKELKADRLTVHVPKASIQTMEQGGKEILGRIYRDYLQQLPDEIQIGIENMHMMQKECADRQRRFGYLPEECIAWADYLSGLTGRKIGLHLDVGHARNNRPFSQKYTLGVWYAMEGQKINAYHIHQTVNENNVFHNHQPIGGIYESLISYGGFLYAWHKGQISHGPMFVEVEDIEKAIDSIRMFERQMGI